MSKTVHAPAFRHRIISVFACSILLLLLCATGTLAQSTDIDQPTPISASQITGQISPRDIGDSRLTRHFYILTGTPGDLVLMVESRNLDGDVDLFQAGSLRPLAKMSMYAGELSTKTSKSIYLRQRETIILRVEARTPNDDKGSYSISFSGGFEAMAAPAVQPETETTAEQTPATARRDRNTKRVNAVGARINEPEPVETAKTTQPETSNEGGTESTTAASEAASREKAETTTTPQPVTTARAQRPPSARSNRRRRGRNVPSRPPETATQNNTGTEVAEAPPAVVSQPSGIEAGARLIIETRDGMRVERYMSTVRRVTVENGQIVVISRDGKVTRHPMANVVRMAIEP